MAKQAKGDMQSGGKRKVEEPSLIAKLLKPKPTGRTRPEAAVVEVDRTMPAAGSMRNRRGDRRDMNRTYTGNVRHASHADNARRDVSTRVR